MRQYKVWIQLSSHLFSFPVSCSYYKKDCVCIGILCFVIDIELSEHAKGFRFTNEWKKDKEFDS